MKLRTAWAAVSQYLERGRQPPQVPVNLNEGLRTYLGSDPQGGVLPYGMAERVKATYGARAESLQANIDQTLDGLLDVPESLKHEPLDRISTFITDRARTLRPDLDLDVCRAIGNYVSYRYR